MGLLNQNALSIQLPTNQQLPDEGPKAIPVRLDFTPSSPATLTYVLDLELIWSQAKISMIQTIFIDNSQNSNALSVTVNGTGQIIVAAANTQGYYAVLCPNPPKLSFSSASSSVALVVFLINIPISGVVWSVS